METFVAILHIIVAIIMIGLVLVQDSKSGSLGGAFGGGGSNSVLGATGAATLAQKLTRWTAVIFAITCIMLTVFINRQQRSVMDSAVLPTAPAAPAAAPAQPAAPETTPAPATK
ncbi:MAG: hypothetical protein BroJett040_02100 [Oligoflexia bacterium]|nr:MAG: hypothetical protein BroJett040_02100 [Oligoflexia bacterium]